MTEHDWRQLLAAVHPDRGGEPRVFVAAVAARTEWQKTHQTCWGCGKVFTPRPRVKREHYHASRCWHLVRSRRVRRRVAAGRGGRSGPAV